MSNINALAELAGFVGKSSLLSEDLPQRTAAMNGLISRLEPRPLRKKATDLLGTVLALSARTRRLIQPRVEVDLDCFAPDGRRAVHIMLPPRD